MLKFLGRIGKGFATIGGSVGTVVGVLTMAVGPEKADAVGQVITAVSGVVAVFGIGRKAGVAATKTL